MFQVCRRGAELCRYLARTFAELYGDQVRELRPMLKDIAKDVQSQIRKLRSIRKQFRVFEELMTHAVQRSDGCRLGCMPSEGAEGQPQPQQHQRRQQEGGASPSSSPPPLPAGS